MIILIYICEDHVKYSHIDDVDLLTALGISLQYMDNEVSGLEITLAQCRIIEI